LGVKKLEEELEYYNGALLTENIITGIVERVKNYLMNLFQKAYEYLPVWLQQGIINWNKRSIELENGSKIYAYATSAAGVRGGSYNLIFLDEFAFVRPSIAQEFWTAITPTLSTGGKAIITSTPNSDEDQFALIWKGANKTEDEFGNTTELGVNGFRAFRAYWHEQPGRDQKWADEMRAQLGDDRFNREIGCLCGESILTLKDISGKVFKATMNDLKYMLENDK
jgi:hypothetical protein